MPEFTVFLDRDGVFNPLPKWGLRRASGMHVYPGVPAAFARLGAAGIKTCLVTNQPWVGAMTCTPGMVRRVNGELQRQLRTGGGELDHIEAAYAPVALSWLPFAPRLWGVRRRKPNPGMLIDGAAALGRRGWAVDKSRAVMVGDSIRDAEAGHRFGIPAILVATKHTPAHIRAVLDKRGVPAVVVKDLAEAVELILKQASSPGTGTR